MAEYRIKFVGDFSSISGDVEKLGGQVEKVGSDSGKKLGAGLSDGIKSAFAGFTLGSLVTSGIQSAMSAISDSFSGMLKTQASLADFSALTGVTGEALQKFGDKAIEMSNKFGGPALDQITAYKGVLSRFGPDLANAPAALNSMTESINILSKASGLDAAASMDALSTAALQFGVDMSNPTQAAETLKNMMNAMAAGAKEGAAEIPGLSEALKQAGVTSAGLGVSFEETVATLEILAQGGKFGSEAGVAMRNVMTSLVDATGPANIELKRIGLTTKELGNILTTQGVGAAMSLFNEKLNAYGTAADQARIKSNVFGKENLAAAGIMLKNADAIGVMTAKVTGTNTAYDQAAINMATWSAQLDRIKSTVSNFVEGGMKTFTSFIVENADYVKLIAIALGTGAIAMGVYTLATSAAGIATSIFSSKLVVAMQSFLTNPIFLSVAALAAFAYWLKKSNDELDSSAEAFKKNGAAEMELVKSKKEANTEEQKRVIGMKETLAMYEKLAGKPTRTRLEEEQLTTAMVKINNEYPGLIKSGDSFEQNLARVQKKSGELTTTLGDLKIAMANLSKEEKTQALVNFSYELDAVQESIIAITKDKDGNVDGMKKYLQQIRNAFNEDEIRKAMLGANDVIGTLGDSKTKAVVAKQLLELAKLQRDYINSTNNQGETGKLKASGVASPLVPTGGEMEKAKKLQEATLADIEKARVANLVAGGEKIQAVYYQELKAIDEEMKKYAESENKTSLTLEKKSAAYRKYVDDLIKDGKDIPTDDIRTYQSDFVDGIQTVTESQLGAIDVTTSWIDELTALGMEYGNLGNTVQDVASGIGGALAGAAKGVEEPWKQMAKQVGNIVIDLAELILLGGTAASFGKAITTFGASLFTDIPWTVAGFAALEIGRGFLNSFAVGAWNIPQNQIAQVHAGEMIIPATYADSVRRGEASISSGNGSSSVYRPPARTMSRQAVTVGFDDTRSMMRSANIRQSNKSQ
jgi:TP901 family phage tail tape measure protein